MASRATQHGTFAAEVLDLRDWPLPLFAEGPATIGDFAGPSYSEPVVNAWNDKQQDADAVIFVTAEYNHSIPGAALADACMRAAAVTGDSSWLAGVAMSVAWFLGDNQILCE